MNKYDIKHYRQINVKFLPSTNKRGARIKLWEVKRKSDDPIDSKIFGIDWSINDVLDQAIELLERNGFKPICRATTDNYYSILCDAYGDNFKLLKDLK